MNIAILGSRGIPGQYGGFETAAHHLSEWLVREGHAVSVYCIRNYSKGELKGDLARVKRVFIPTVRSKWLEKTVFANLSMMHVCFTRAQVVLLLGVSGGPLCFLPRLFGKKVICNIDGLEWQRKKWGPLARWCLRVFEKMAVRFSNAVVSDARCVQKYCVDEYGRESTYIPYGAELLNYRPGQTMDRFGLEPGRYFLYVSRLEPENNAHLVVDAFNRVSNTRGLKLVVVGDAPFARDYIDSLKDIDNPNIVFTGYVFGDGYRELQSNAFAYIQATEVGGTHPALVEAMAFGNCILANDVPEHREVLGEAGLFFATDTPDDLAGQMDALLRQPEMVPVMGRRAQDVVRNSYLWDYICEAYERLFRSVLFGEAAEPARRVPAELEEEPTPVSVSTAASADEDR